MTVEADMEKVRAALHSERTPIHLDDALAALDRIQAQLEAAQRPKLSDPNAPDDPRLEELADVIQRVEAERDAAVEALRNIRWLHHDDHDDYRHLFIRAQALASAVLSGQENQDA